MLDDSREVDIGGHDAAWEAWRTRALNALLVAACILGLPVATPGFFGEAGLPPRWRLIGMAIYLVLLLNTICRGWGFRARSWVMVVLAYGAASVALANRGLVGFGRVALAVYPFVVTLLLGPRAGWITTGMSLGIYGVFTAMSFMGVLRDWNMAMDDPASPTLWLLQGMGLALAIVPGMILANRFRLHHMRILDAERRVLQQLHEEATRRTTAYESLDREQAERMKLEERIVQLGEEERRRLGREIHDGLCQQLTAALLRCTALQEQLKNRQIAESSQAERLRSLIQEMLDGAYVISKGVWPVGPEPDDLVPALQAMIKRTSEEFDAKCEFRHQGDIGVADGQTAMHLYRIAQEAVSNAIRHANARRIVVVLQGEPDGILLKVEDDGCGPPDADRPSGGMGLSIMAYRARAMSGTLTVTHAEGGGTAVTCRVPCAQVERLEGVRDGKRDNRSVPHLRGG